jgi:intracellular septation protein A
MPDAPTMSADPPGNFSFRQMMPTLIYDVALPIVAFNVLTRYGVSPLLALVAGGIFPAANNIITWIRSRRLEPLGIIVMIFLAVGTAASLISGSVFFALIKESFLTATFGLICLFSLLAERPLMFYIVRQFVAGDDPARLEWWNGLWQFDSFRRSQRVATTVWGVAYIIEALLRVAFATVMSPAEVVAISPVMAFGVMILLIMWTRRYMTAMRDRHAREMQLSAAG